MPRVSGAAQVAPGTIARARLGVPSTRSPRLPSGASPEAAACAPAHKRKVTREKGSAGNWHELVPTRRQAIVSEWISLFADSGEPVEQTYRSSIPRPAMRRATPRPWRTA